jgi:hypothetical protein
MPSRLDRPGIKLAPVGGRRQVGFFKQYMMQIDFTANIAQAWYAT